jgi:hypothetical protein
MWADKDTVFLFSTIPVEAEPCEEIANASRHLKSGSLVLNWIIPHSPLRGPGMGV